MVYEPVAESGDLVPPQHLWSRHNVVGPLHRSPDLRQQMDQPAALQFLCHKRLAHERHPLAAIAAWITAAVELIFSPRSQRSKVQGANDFLVFGTVACASFSAGSLLHSSGWETINWIVLPAVALVLVPLVWRAARPARG
jgi:hypothetical protein